LDDEIGLCRAPPQARRRAARELELQFCETYKGEKGMSVMTPRTGATVATV
jgi:hypothetical protein